MEQSSKRAGLSSRKSICKRYGFVALAFVAFGGVAAYTAFTSENVTSTAASSAAVAPVADISPSQQPDAAVISAAAASASIGVVDADVAAAHIEHGARMTSMASAATSAPVASSGTALASADTAAPGAGAAARSAVATPASTGLDKRASAGSRNKSKPQGTRGSTARTAGQAVTASKARARRSDTESRKGKDDADTALVAAIIARLDRRGPSPESIRAFGVTNAVQKCAVERDPVQCVARICEGHWGKVDVCPASRALKQPAYGTGDGRRG